VVISRAAVSEFLSRPLRDSDKAKRFSRCALERKVAKLDPTPEFEVEPWDHQLATFLLMAKYPGYMLLHDMGLGKSACILNSLRWRKAADQLDRVLILVPNTSNVQTFGDEAAIHAPELGRALLDDQADTQDRLRYVEDEHAHVTVMTYAGLLHLVCDKDTSGTRNKLKASKKKLRALGDKFGAIVADESSFIGNHQSLTFQTLRKLRGMVDFRYGLSGTPFGGDPSALWSQFYFVDGGDTLGPTLGLFRSAFFHEVCNEFSGWYDYEFDDSMMSELYRMLRHGSIRYADHECQDLPKMIKCVRRTRLGEEVMAYYEKILSDFRGARGNYQVMQNEFIRLRQLASGYVGLKDDEENKIEIDFGHNPKLDALVSDLSALPSGCQAVVFNEFTYSGDTVEKRLAAEGIGCGRIYGGARDKGKILKDFQLNKFPVLVLQSQSGAFGLNLQNANYVHFYELPVDPKTRRQAIKRCYRAGQTKRVYVYDYVTSGGLDGKILASLEAGKDLFNSIVDGEGTL